MGKYAALSGVGIGGPINGALIKDHLVRREGAGLVGEHIRHLPFMD